MLDAETELGTSMLVSRTFVREALMMLEEDGLIRAGRGVGRFVSDTLPRIGIERIRSFEEVLGGPGHQIQIKRIQVERQPASEFRGPRRKRRTRHRGLALRVRLIRDGEPIAHLQESISAQPVSFARGAAAPLAIKDNGGTPLLGALNRAAGRGLGPGERQISLSQVGPSRARLLPLPAGAGNTRSRTSYRSRRSSHPLLNP